MFLLDNSLYKYLFLVNISILQSGSEERRIPGNTITVQEDMPYKGLTIFGSAFLSKLECSQMPHPVSSISVQLFNVYSSGSELFLFLFGEDFGAYDSH